MPSIERKIAPRPWLKQVQNHTNRRNWEQDQKFYHSPAWKAIRQRILQRDPLCVECKAKGIIKASKVVDHIKPMSQGGDPLSEANLQGLCKECHDVKSATERWSKDEKDNK